MPGRLHKTDESVPEVQYSRLTRRLVGIFIFGLVLFHPPMLAVFGQGVRLGETPLLFVYVFAAWAAVVAALALAVGRTGESDGDG